MKRLIVAVGLVIAALAVVGAAAGGEEKVAAPTPQIVYVTPIPQGAIDVPATGTPEPTVEPTEEPTDSPFVLFGAYLGQMTEFLDTTNVNALSAALDATDAPAALRVVRLILANDAKAAAWLADNPPADCYADIHGEMSAAYADSLPAYEAQGRWLTVFPYGSETDIETFTDRIAKAGVHIEAATAGLDAAGAACD